MARSEFFNVWDYITPEYPFNIFIGGRRMGKTYSALKGVTVEKNTKFIYMRRTGKQLQFVSDKKGVPGKNPFEDINRDCGTSYGLIRSTDNESVIVQRTYDEEGRMSIEGLPVGTGICLTGISSAKGIADPDIEYLIYDEFIKEPIEKRIPKEAEGFFSMYDTLCSNRELKGIPPICAILLSNSTDIYNPLFIALHLVHDAERMCETGQQHKYYKDMGLALHILEMSESLKEKRRNTAIMRLTADTEYGRMALENKFAYNDFSLIGYKPIKGYRPVCKVNGGYIYSKKGTNEWHVCYAKASTAQQYNTKNKHDLLLFKRTYGAVIGDKFPRGEITFESYELKADIMEIVFGER